MKHNWEYRQLGEICEILDSQRKPVTKSDRIPGPYPYYGASGIQDYVSDYIFDGDFLLVGEDGAKWGANEKSAFSISGKSWVNNHAHILDFKKSRVSQKLVEYFLCSCDLNKIITGTIVPKLTQKNLVSIRIPVPPMEVQEQIVAELDKINETIEDCRELLRDLDALAQSLFYDFFGDPILNQKGWETNTIEQICISIVRGPFGGALKKEIFVPKSHNTYKVYEQKHAIQKNAQIGTYYICENDFKRLKRFELIPGDIIMSCSGTIGEFFKLPLTAEAGVMNQALLKFSLSDKVDSIYFLFLMKDMKRLFTIYGTGLQNISSVTTVKHVSIPVPPLELQKKFAERIEQIEAQKKAVEETIENLQTLLDSRMDYWFN